ncbi:hypothetical protein JCM10212_002374 [Sporobolomyces blumeae]
MSSSTAANPARASPPRPDRSPSTLDARTGGAVQGQGHSMSTNGTTAGREKEKFGDVQISQILAEMSQQNAAATALAASPRGSRSKGQLPPDQPASNGSHQPLHPHSIPVASTSSAVLDQPATLMHSGAPHRLNSSATAPDPPPVASSSGNGALQQEEDKLGPLPKIDDGDSDSKAKGKATRKGRGKSEERQGMKEDEWEKSRKANHKEVERRRRETINAGISAIALLLPPPPGAASTSGSSTTTTTTTTTMATSTLRTNKSDILVEAANYIKHLKEKEQSDLNKWAIEKVLLDQRCAAKEKEADELARLLKEKEYECEGYKKVIQELVREEGQDEREQKKRRL